MANPGLEERPIPDEIIDEIYKKSVLESTEIAKKYKTKITDTVRIECYLRKYYLNDYLIKQNSTADLSEALVSFIDEVIPDLEKIVEKYPDEDIFKKLSSCYSHLIAHFYKLSDSNILHHTIDYYIKRKTDSDNNKLTILNEPLEGFNA